MRGDLFAESQQFGNFENSEVGWVVSRAHNYVNIFIFRQSSRHGSDAVIRVDNKFALKGATYKLCEECREHLTPASEHKRINWRKATRDRPHQPAHRPVERIMFC